MKNHRKLLAFAALIVPLLACLVPNLDTEKFAKTRPSPVDLAGHYVPMAETLKLVKDSGAYPDVDMAVDINVDGTMTFTNLPDWWRTRSGEPGGEMDSGSAHWTVEKQQSWWEFAFTTEKVSTSIPIVGQSRPYYLWFTIGDPDNGDVLVFKQVIDKRADAHP